MEGLYININYFDTKLATLNFTLPRFQIVVILSPSLSLRASSGICNLLSKQFLIVREGTGEKGGRPGLPEA